MKNDLFVKLFQDYSKNVAKFPWIELDTFELSTMLSNMEVFLSDFKLKLEELGFVVVNVMDKDYNPSVKLANKVIFCKQMIDKPGFSSCLVKISTSKQLTSDFLDVLFSKDFDVLKFFHIYRFDISINIPMSFVDRYYSSVSDLKAGLLNLSAMLSVNSKLKMKFVDDVTFTFYFYLPNQRVIRCYLRNGSLRFEFQRVGSHYWEKSLIHLKLKDRVSFFAYEEGAKGFDLFLNLLPDSLFKSMIASFCDQKHETPLVLGDMASIVKKKDAFIFPLMEPLLTFYSGDSSDDSIFLNLLSAKIFKTLFEQHGSNVFLVETDIPKNVSFTRQDLISMLNNRSQKLNSKQFFFGLLKKLSSLVCYEDLLTRKWVISTLDVLEKKEGPVPVHIVPLSLINAASFYSEGSFEININPRVFVGFLSKNFFASCLRGDTLRMNAGTMFPCTSLQLTLLFFSNSIGIDDWSQVEEKFKALFEAYSLMVFKERSRYYLCLGKCSAKTKKSLWRQLWNFAEHQNVLREASLSNEFPKIRFEMMKDSAGLEVRKFEDLPLDLEGVECQLVFFVRKKPILLSALGE